MAALDGKRVLIEVSIPEPWNIFTSNRISRSRLNSWIYPHSYTYWMREARHLSEGL